MKKFLFACTALIACGAAVVKLSQIKSTSTVPTLLVTFADGTVKQAASLNGGISVDAGGNVSISPAAVSVPVLSTFKIGTAPQSSFPIPANKTSCIVFNSILMNPVDDYNANAGAIVFNPGVNFPQPGDTIQLLCF